MSNRRELDPAATRRSIADETDRLLREYARTGDVEVRNRIVLLHERVVHYFARRFSVGGGASYEDLVQVGYIGLINAVEHFNRAEGAAFVTYACPTVAGVIKRYLRDHTWTLKVPRRLRELGIKLRGVRSRLEQSMGRSPTFMELAAETGVSEELVAEALHLESIYQPMSLDAPRKEDLGGTEPMSIDLALGALDPEIERIDYEQTVAAAIHTLPEREQAIIYSRFVEERPQSYVAEQLNISQMHVSRLERRALQALREVLRR